MIQNKRGLSEIVGYVLLIVIALALAGLVYGFLIGFVPKDTEKCPSDISVAIIGAKCADGISNAEINLSLQNKGLFNVNGFYARGGEDVKKPAMIALKTTDGGIEVIGKIFFKLSQQVLGNKTLAPGEKQEFIMTSSDPVRLAEINKIEIEPFIIGKKGALVLCEESITSVEATC